MKHKVAAFFIVLPLLIIASIFIVCLYFNLIYEPIFGTGGLQHPYYRPHSQPTTTGLDILIHM